MTQKTNSPHLEQNAPEGIALTAAEEKAARKEGAKADVQEAAQASHKFLTDGGMPGEPAVTPYLGSDESQRYAYLLERGVDQFQELLDGKAKDAPQINDTQVHGLLALERNGQNRTPYVRAMMKRLKLKADELPGGGPGYTNDMTNITDL